MSIVDHGVKQILLSNSPFGPGEVRQLIEAIRIDFTNYRQLGEAVQELESREEQTPAVKVRLGVSYYLRGRYRQAAATLRSADGGALALFYMAKAQHALGDYAAAVSAFQDAAKAGYDADACTLGRAESLRYARDLPAALAALDQLSGAIEQSAEYLYQRAATIAAIGGNPEETVRLYERAVETDGRHAGALFGLAMENDRRGNDDTALSLYQRSAADFPPHYGSLLNLGILYEDRQQFDRARQCYQRILEVMPDDGRARLYLKDASAGSNMLFDEEAAKRRDRIGQLLGIPVTDFELSVRSRNCLQKMGVMTLGDLTRTTEQELLSSKNFGETSLTEIKDMLTSKGLSLGQFATERRPTDAIGGSGGPEPEAVNPDEQAVLSKSIADLQLSVRARKCMARLGIATIGELLRRTGDELLECKNFGVTSLNEVREKLTQMNLKLRGE